MVSLYVYVQSFINIFPYFFTSFTQKFFFLGLSSLLFVIKPKTFVVNKIKIKIISLKNNSGKGSALKLGVKKAKYDWILTADIDMSVSLFQFSNWLKKRLINLNANAKNNMKVAWCIT